VSLNHHASLPFVCLPALERFQIIFNAEVEKGMENKGTYLWWNHDASIGAAVVGKKAHLRMKLR